VFRVKATASGGGPAVRPNQKEFSRRREGNAETLNIWTAMLELWRGGVENLVVGIWVRVKICCGLCPNSGHITAPSARLKKEKESAVAGIRTGTSTDKD